MKKTFLMLLLASASVAFAQKPVKVQGTIDDASITKLYIQVGEEGNYGSYKPEETLEVKKGKFTFSKQINTIVPLNIKKESGDDGSVTTVFLVPGENMKLSLKGGEYFYDGSKIYKEMNAADVALTPAYKDFQGYYEVALDRLRNTPEEQQQALSELLSDTLTTKRNNFQKLLKEYKDAHINEEGSVLYLSNYINTEELYNSISDKDSQVAKYLKTQLDYVAKMREAQAKAQAERQAKLDAMNGAEAKDFTLNDIKGNPLSLSSLRGKYVILDFWGSWCGWCIKGIPDMKKYYEKYAGKFEILGVDCNDTEEKWKNAVEKYELPWLHVYNPRNSSVLEDYGVTGFPTKIVISPEGKIAKVIVGEDPAFYTYLDEIFSK